MPRYRNTETGIVVNVPEEKLANLVGYESADAEKAAPAPEKPAAQKPGPKPAAK